MFDSLTAFVFLLQISRFVEQGITCRTIKCFNNKIKVHHMAKIIVRLARSPVSIPSTIFMSFRKTLRVSRSAIIGVLFKWTHGTNLGLSLFILVLRKLKIFVVSSSSISESFKWRARATAQNSQIFAIWQFCSLFELQNLTKRFFNRVLADTVSSEPIGTLLSRAANTPKFFNF